MADMETRTEQGYAFWKEDPKWVKKARDFATLFIAKNRIKAEVLKPVTWVIKWLSFENELRTVTVTERERDNIRELAIEAAKLGLRTEDLAPMARARMRELRAKEPQ